jgi:hypothetical protein
MKNEVYEPKDIQIGSKNYMSYKERLAYLQNSELGGLYGFRQNGSIQSSD